jgi:thymidylate kinase
MLFLPVVFIYVAVEPDVAVERIVNRAVRMTSCSEHI